MNLLWIELTDSVRLSTKDRNLSNSKRQSLIKEAKKFKGNRAKEANTKIYTNKNYSVSLKKPGKEVFVKFIKHKDGHKGNNKNDMSVILKFKGKRIDHDGTFSEIFSELNKLSHKPNMLKVIGALIVRNAYCIDHIEVSKGMYRYSPPKQVVSWLKKHQEKKMLFEIESFLHYIDAIAWNEDVKYHTLGYQIQQGYGRRNNLMTYAHSIGVITGDVDFMKFAGSLMRPPVGVSPISLVKAIDVFDLLSSSKKPLPKAP